MEQMQIDSAFLQDIVQRIVDHVHPQRIVLFGSYARGTAGHESDLDLLVIVPDTVPRRECSVCIYRLLAGIGVSKDIVVVHASDVQRFGNLPGSVLEPALSEGKVLYDAAA